MTKSATDTLGAITFLMMRSPAHRQMTLEQIRDFVLPPLGRKLAITATVTDDNGVASPLAYALFAKVNDDWDARLRDPNFQLHELPQEAWESGGNKWLIEYLSVRKASGDFIEQAARRIFPKGGTLHIRGRDSQGRAEIGKRRF